MRTIVSIPSGHRTKQLLNIIEKWRKVSPDFEIAIYTWCDETRQEAENKVDYFFYGDLQSFAVNQNTMARDIKGWDIFICAADDLWPEFGISKIETVCRSCPGKVIWVKDGLFNAQATHPIITRGWYDRYGFIFDENFRHNYCDTDLFVRILRAREVVKCFSIGFDHRHYLKTGKPQDAIYEIGSETFTQDRILFYEKYPKTIEKHDFGEIKEIEL